MGLSTERKVFVAVLGVAGAALVIDRGILGPADASASATLPVAASEAALPDIPVTATIPAQSSETMAQILMQRLDGIQSQQGQHSLSAAFSLEKFMSGPSESQDASEETADQGGSTRVLDLITPELPSLPKLSALMPSSNGGGGAVLNGKLVRVGGKTDEGYVLIEVRKRSVVLLRDERQYTVEMPMQTRP
jgi:hypothetical protein